MKRIISILLTLAMLLGVSIGLVSAEDNMPFTDVKLDSWYGKEVLTVHSLGIMKGTGDGKFEPMTPMTRAEVVTVLYRLSEELIWGVEDILTFTDVKLNKWYTDAVAWSVSCGIVKGYPDNTFKPSAPITRQEIAKMLACFIEYMEITSKGTPLTDSFADSATFPKWAASHIESLKEYGLMGGDEKGRFNPTSNASRAEIATVITRLLPLMDSSGEDEGDDDDGDEYVPAPAPEDFELCMEEGTPYPYYIRFPEGYSESAEYPLVIFASGKGDVSINSVDAIFYSEESPAYDSIVMIPAVKTEDDLQNADGLISYVKEKYSVDRERVYLIVTGEDRGGFCSWFALEKTPDAVSALLVVHDGVSGLMHKGNGNNEWELEGIIIGRITADALEKLKTLPIYYYVCDDQNQYTSHWLDADYGKEFLIAAEAAGITNVTIKEPSGYNTIFDDFAVRNNNEAFNWLFAQRRATN